jgi:hypothetical protein
MVKSILYMLAAVTLDLLLFRLFRDSQRPVDAPDSKGDLIQHLVSNLTALLKALLYFCTNVFFSNTFLLCCLQYIQYFSVNVWHLPKQFRLKSKIVHHYKIAKMNII